MSAWCTSKVISEQHSDSDVLAERAVAVVLDGSRAFVIEIQEFVKDHLLFLLMDSTQHLMSLNVKMRGIDGFTTCCCLSLSNISV
nr:DNA repair protein RadA like [Ipomoea batatas]GMD48235.1 DNA repair protein RadA like [Ipomoea batatas]